MRRAANLSRCRRPSALVRNELALAHQDDRVHVVLVRGSAGNLARLVGVRDDDRRRGQLAERPEEIGLLAVRNGPALERIHDDDRRVLPDARQRLTPRDRPLGRVVRVRTDPANALRRGARADEKRLDLGDVHLAIEPVDGAPEALTHARGKLGNDGRLTHALLAGDKDLPAQLDAAEHIGERPAELPHVTRLRAVERAHRDAGGSARRRGRRRLERLPRVAIDPLLRADRADARRGGGPRSFAATTEENNGRSHRPKE